MLEYFNLIFRKQYFPPQFKNIHGNFRKVMDDADQEININCNLNSASIIIGRSSLFWKTNVSTDSFVRPDGGVCLEYKTSNKNGSKHAEVFHVLKNGDLIRVKYHNYIFRGLLGGYWFSAKTEFEYWTSV